MYFVLFKLKSWGKRSTVRRRRFNQRFHLVYSLIISIYHAVGAGLRTCLTVLGCCILIHLFSDGIECLLHFIHCVLDCLQVSALVCFLQLVDGSLYGSLLILGSLITQFAQGLFLCNIITIVVLRTGVNVLIVGSATW